MRVVTLGTGSPIPDPNRAGPSTLVTAGDHHFLVDCGRGVLMRLAAAGEVGILPALEGLAVEERGPIIDAGVELHLAALELALVAFHLAPSQR